MATWCNCDVPPGQSLSPHCPTHSPADYKTWLTGEAPRCAAAEEAGDPFIDRDDWPADAAEIPEFAAHRAALSEAGRRWFDADWELHVTVGEWPSREEAALWVRDAGPSLVAAHERNAARAHLAQVGREESYPIGGRQDDFVEYTTPATAEELLAEADQLAELVRRALHVESILRRDAAELAGEQS